MRFIQICLTCLRYRYDSSVDGFVVKLLGKGVSGVLLDDCFMTAVDFGGGDVFARVFHGGCYLGGYMISGDIDRGSYHEYSWYGVRPSFLVMVRFMVSVEGYKRFRG